MAGRWSKKQRKELRELQGLAWERELSEALRSLRQEFDAWEQGEISAFELSDRIHKFHNGRSRELFHTYAGSPEAIIIESAVARGVLDESELSEDLHAGLSEGIAYFRRRSRKSDGSTESEQ